MAQKNMYTHGLEGSVFFYPRKRDDKEVSRQGHKNVCRHGI